MKNEWNCKYDPLVDIESITAIYLNIIFNSPSVMYDKEAECASVMTTNGLLTNQFFELDHTSWAGVFVRTMMRIW